jgi:hypothetical protein
MKYYMSYDMNFKVKVILRYSELWKLMIEEMGRPHARFKHYALRT